MSVTPDEAIARARRLMDDAASFRLASVPLPVTVLATLVETAEKGIALSEEQSGR